MFVKDDIKETKGSEIITSTFILAAVQFNWDDLKTVFSNMTSNKPKDVSQSVQCSNEILFLFLMIETKGKDTCNKANKPYMTTQLIQHSPLWWPHDRASKHDILFKKLGIFILNPFTWDILSFCSRIKPNRTVVDINDKMMSHLSLSSNMMSNKVMILRQ